MREKLTGNLVRLVFEGLPKDDLNTLILEFNYRMDAFFLGDTLKLLSLAEQGENFKKNLDEFKKILADNYKDIKQTLFQKLYQIQNLLDSNSCLSEQM